MTTQTTPRLSDEQVAFYRERGYLLPKQQVFAPEKFAGLAKHFEKLLADWQDDPRLRSPEHMDVPHFLDPTLFEWLFDDDVLDLVEPILGPDIALFSSHFLCKPAGTGKRVPWHEDTGYWRGRLDPMEVLTVWLAVDPSKPANGCMRVIPGTHNTGAAGFSEYEKVTNPDKQVFDTEIRKDLIDESKAVDCILEAGEASLHDGRLMHGSNANTSDLRRCGYTMRYISAATRHVAQQDHGNNIFKIYLARGKDRAGNLYGDPTKANQDWIDAHSNGFPAGH